MKRFVLLLVAGLTACAAPHAQLAGADDGLRRCLLLTTNDSESNFDGAVRDPTGKSTFTYPLARVATAKKTALAERPGGVLLLEGGDVLQGRFLERKDGDRPRAVAENWPLYEHAGYDLGVLGNHEFDNGPKAVRRGLQALTTLRILSANLDGAGTALDPIDPAHPQGLYGATALRTCGGIRVGFLGLTTPSTRTISDLGDVKLRPLAEAGRKAVAELRTHGAEVIVLLSHLGVDEDRSLVAEVSGIDVIVGGHSHTRLERPVRVGKTLITQTGARFERLGRIDLAVTAAGEVDPGATTYRLDAPAIHEPDPTLVAETNALIAGLVEERVVGQRSIAWDVMSVARSEYAKRATKAVAWYAGKVSGRHVDAGLLNNGGFRSHTVYPPGPVTNLEISAIHPFRNYVVLVTLTGQLLKDTLEHACGYAKTEAHGANSTVWGIDVRCDVTREPVQYAWVDNRATSILRHGDRATDIRVGGQPLDLQKTYTLATLDYLARGGSSYLPLQLGERKCLDGSAFVPEDKRSCGGTALLSDVLTEAVTAGELERP